MFVNNFEKTIVIFQNTYQNKSVEYHSAISYIQFYISQLKQYDDSHEITAFLSENALLKSKNMQKLVLETKWCKLEFEDNCNNNRAFLIAQFKANKPVMVFQDKHSSQIVPATNHAIILYGYKRESNMLYYFDPEDTEYHKISALQFRSTLHEKNFFFMYNILK
jgi:hypothetical protein